MRFRLLLSCSLPILFFMTWRYLVDAVRTTFPPLHDKQIALLIAHPDDEAMFFSPTLLALSEPSLNNHIKILCLCSGQIEHLRETRKSELFKSGAILGPKDIAIIDDHRFPDNMTLTWDPEDIASVLSSKLAPSMEDQSSSGDADARASVFDPSNIDIDVLLTFDSQGISSHANHISLYYGALHWLRKVDPTGSKVSIYSLTTTNIVLKYLSLFDVPFSFISTQRSSRDSSDRLLFLSSYAGYRKAQEAMTDGHVSQMAWFRWGWIWLSRYMIVNDLKLEYPLVSSN